MATFYMLVGPPGSGKSTWRDAHMASATRPTVIISRDDLIEVFAKANGLTYTQAFTKVNQREIVKQTRDDCQAAVARGDDVIVDLTNMNKKIRRRFLQWAPDTYTKVAVVFSVSDSVLRKRLDDRAKATGKSIPPHVIENMLSIYEAPDRTEFDRIEKVR